MLTLDSTPTEIKAGYRIASPKSHPDRTSSVVASVFMEVQPSFDYLTHRQSPKDKQELLQDQIAVKQSELAILPLHQSSLVFLYGFLCQIVAGTSRPIF